MSVTALTARAGRQTSPSSGSGRPGAVLRRSAPPIPPPATLTLTLAIPLTGEAMTPPACRLLDAVRELVELGQGTITVGPPAEASVPAARSRVAAEPAVGPTSANHAAATQAPPSHPVPHQASGPAGGHYAGPLEPRREHTVDRHFPADQLEVDPAEVRLLTASRQVLVGGEPLPTTRLEFDLLVFLANNPRRVFTRTQLLGAVWGYEHTGERTVDVHVRRLRLKMGVHVPLITTVYGVGYRLADDAVVAVVAAE